MTAVEVPARPSPGCALAPTVTGQQTMNFSTTDDDGSYIEEIPTSSSTGRPLPVIFDFHAYTEPANVQVAVSGLGAYGQSQGFITITPWVNGEPVPIWLSTPGSKDLVWFGQLLTHVEATVCIDENRVFATGLSNGAFMTSAVACQYSSRVAAVAPVSGIQTETPCRTTRPVPVVAFHGTADPLVRYDGRASKVSANLSAPDGSGRTIDAAEEKLFGVKGVFEDGPTIPQEAAAWAKRNGCSRSVSTTKITSDVDLLSWSCPHDANVELYRIAGGGHTWPGSKLLASVSVDGRTTLSISTDVLVWHFFEAHPLDPSD